MATAVNEEETQQPDASSIEGIEETKTLICALNLLSRNLPLPSHILQAVSRIYSDPLPGDADGGSRVAADENVDAPVRLFCFYIRVY